MRQLLYACHQVTRHYEHLDSVTPAFTSLHAAKTTIATFTYDEDWQNNISIHNTIRERNSWLDLTHIRSWRRFNNCSSSRTQTSGTNNEPHCIELTSFSPRDIETARAGSC